VSSLCSRNARPQKDREGAARCPSCSQNAHDQNVLVRCAQYRAASATPFEARGREVEGIRLTRAEGDSSEPSWGQRTRASLEGSLWVVRCRLACGMARLGAPGLAGEKSGLFEHPVLFGYQFHKKAFSRWFVCKPSFSVVC
jgi:hypothetical protein